MILVIAEQRDGVVNRASWEAIAAAQALGDTVKVVLLGSALDAPAAELATAAADEVIVVEHAALDSYTADGWVLALAGLVGAEKSSLVVFPHTYQTRDFPPRWRRDSDARS
jgi:electron transfer flavoprotein alpha subunit